MLPRVSATTEPLVRALNVVYLYVSDMERSLAFYRDLLGIPLRGDDDWQEASLGGTRFALHRTHEGVGELSAGTIHVDFEVRDLTEATERLRAAGIEANDAMRDDWGAAAEVTDPDGYGIFLFEPPR
jgi:catechol 2,3-dioxygenase-like lactoylglutathione lyase family enzyme